MAKLERRGLFYRVVIEDYVNDKMGPLPSRAQEGRFHDQGMELVTYLAGGAETAWMEVGARWQGHPDPEPYRMLEVRANVARVADLTDPSIRRKYGVELSALVGTDWKPCQRLARRLRAEGFEALWTFSRADYPPGRQLVVFLSQLNPGSYVRVVNVHGIREIISLD